MKRRSAVQSDWYRLGSILLLLPLTCVLGIAKCEYSKKGKGKSNELVQYILICHRPKVEPTLLPLLRNRRLTRILV